MTMQKSHYHILVRSLSPDHGGICPLRTVLENGLIQLSKLPLDSSFDRLVVNGLSDLIDQSSF